ncbi:MAG: alpha-galactosidase [Prevotella sp.]
MRTLSHIAIAAIAMMLMPASAVAENVAISTPGNTMVLDITKGVEPKFVYYGQRLSEADLAALPAPTTANWSMTDIYPAYGANRIQDEVCLAMRHADGNLSTQLVCQGYELRDVTDKAPNAAERRARLLTITLADPLYPTTVTLNYLAYTDVDIIESWAEITNGEKKTVTLTQFLSSMMPIRRNDVWVSHMHGSWAAEAQLSQHKLENGQLRIKNKDGLRNATTDRQELMFSLEGRPQENHGDVIGAALMYSGNYAVNVDTREGEYHYFSAGINPDNSEYHLDRGQTLRTPHVAYTFSAEGLSGASRAYHRWARRYQLRHGNDERMILLNSWEGVYFDINQKGMDQMMADIKSMGGELFVMDDGWFGDKYPRKTDNSSLGDWVVDRQKLPEGIEGLLRDARKNGVKFGIWIEPEMTNSVSELYEKHPDWIIKAPRREPVMGRGGTQLVLDMSNPKVQDFVFSVVDDLLTKYPEIAYIKWDANAPIMNHGSQYLPMDRQSHLYVAYHEGLIKTCERIRAKYPDVIIQDCASGGGRANYGLLPYFDEFWVSDNTDALQRIYMQWGTSYFYPAIAMASHISATPNHAVFRTTSMKLRCDVAMSGRLGMEIQPKNMTDEEKALCRQAISDYKAIRPIVQFGDIYRLHSPYEGDNLASLMYVAEDKSKAVFYWYKLETFQNQHFPPVKMQGLDAGKRYRVHELNRIDNKPLDCEGKVYTGRYLMANGLEMPYTHDVDYAKKNDWASRVLLLEEVK